MLSMNWKEVEHVNHFSNYFRGSIHQMWYTLCSSNVHLDKSMILELKMCHTLRAARTQRVQGNAHEKPAYTMVPGKSTKSPKHGRCGECAITRWKCFGETNHAVDDGSGLKTIAWNMAKACKSIDLFSLRSSLKFKPPNAPLSERISHGRLSLSRGKMDCAA